MMNRILPLRFRAALVLPALLAAGTAWAVEVRSIVPPPPGDDALAQAIKNRLSGRPGLDVSGVDVGVTDGVVDLTGLVESLHAKTEIQTLVAGLRGVVTLRNDIAVRRVDTPDTFLQAEAERKIGQYPRLANSGLSVEVQEATATLSGEVALARDRFEAGEVVGEVKGIREIRNTIQVAQADVDPRIVSRRLTRLLDNKLVFGKIDNLEVQVAEGGVTTLKGTVASQADRLKAEEIAYGVVGVTSVTNELVVGPLPNASAP